MVGLKKMKPVKQSKIVKLPHVFLLIMLLLLLAGCAEPKKQPMTMKQKQFELQSRLKTGEPLDGLDIVGDKWIVTGFEK